jgi:hypothetical protein
MGAKKDEQGFSEEFWAGFVDFSRFSIPAQHFPPALLVVIFLLCLPSPNVSLYSKCRGGGGTETRFSEAFCFCCCCFLVFFLLRDSFTRPKPSDLAHPSRFLPQISASCFELRLFARVFLFYCSEKNVNSRQLQVLSNIKDFFGARSRNSEEVASDVVPSRCISTPVTHPGIFLKK